MRTIGGSWAEGSALSVDCSVLVRGK